MKESDQLLDDEVIEFSPKKPNPTLKNWVVLILLWIGAVIQLFFGVYFTEAQTIISYGLGYSLLVLATVLAFIRFDYGQKATFILLILGTLRLANCLPVRTDVSFGIAELQVHFDVVFLLLLVIHILMNRGYFSKFIKWVLRMVRGKENKLTYEKKQRNAFKENFSKKTNEELLKIAENYTLNPNAVAAAKDLLEERK